MNAVVRGRDVCHSMFVCTAAPSSFEQQLVCVYLNIHVSIFNEFHVWCVKAGRTARPAEFAASAAHVKNYVKKLPAPG